MKNAFITAILAIGLAFIPVNAQALTMKQFMQICHSAKSKCSQHPVLNAYIGGSLDLFAALQEQNLFKTKDFCANARPHFNVPAIIDHMEKNQAAYANKNAMLSLVSYFKKKGGC
ncbi:MAG: hypothetical protein OFPI_25240 [Osedax symbiont Rs2]|nr:MAG: hypothetical protein OFPI_25240 [Osedax symbiont Rs2]